MWIDSTWLRFIFALRRFFFPIEWFIGFAENCDCDSCARRGNVYGEKLVGDGVLWLIQSSRILIRWEEEWLLLFCCCCYWWVRCLCLRDIYLIRGDRGSWWHLLVLLSETTSIARLLPITLTIEHHPPTLLIVTHPYPCPSGVVILVMLFVFRGIFVFGFCDIFSARISTLRPHVYRNTYPEVSLHFFFFIHDFIHDSPYPYVTRLGFNAHLVGDMCIIWRII